MIDNVIKCCKGPYPNADFGIESADVGIDSDDFDIESAYYSGKISRLCCRFLSSMYIVVSHIYCQVQNLLCPPPQNRVNKFASPPFKDRQW